MRFLPRALRATAASGLALALMVVGLSATSAHADPISAGAQGIIDCDSVVDVDVSLGGNNPYVDLCFFVGVHVEM